MYKLGENVASSKKPKPNKYPKPMLGRTLCSPSELKPETNQYPKNNVLSSNFGFTKSGGQSLTNTDNHITRLEKPKLDDNIWGHGLPSPSDIGLISVSVRGRTQGSPLHWFRILVGFRFLFEATFSPN
jgi:hypothetical protein